VNPQPTGFNPLLPPGVQPTYQQPYPGAPANSQTGGVSPSFPYSTQPGAQGAPTPFAQPGLTINPGQLGQSQALSLINQILTTPRAGGVAGTSQPMAGAQIGPGIAGIASTLERKGIKIYNEKQKYNEWEFIYDLTKDTKGMAGTTGIPGAPQQGTQAQQTPGAQSPFGGQSAFGGQSGFGGQQSGFGQQPQQQFQPQQQQQFPQPQFQPQQQYPPQPPQPQPQPVNPP
jgi:hypothetical protein